MLKYLKGDKVPIVGGGLQGIVGAFVEQRRDDAVLTISIFGALRDVLVPTQHVATINAD